jgi:hypothetical protein
MAALYWPLSLARRVARVHRMSTTSAVARELRIVPVVNAAMRTILDAEMRLVAAGWEPPIGTSLLAIARRDDSNG